MSVYENIKRHAAKKDKEFSSKVSTHHRIHVE